MDSRSTKRLCKVNKETGEKISIGCLPNDTLLITRTAGHTISKCYGVSVYIAQNLQSISISHYSVFLVCLGILKAYSALFVSL